MRYLRRASNSIPRMSSATSGAKQRASTGSDDGSAEASTTDLKQQQLPQPLTGASDVHIDTLPFFSSHSSASSGFFSTLSSLSPPHRPLTEQARRTDSLTGVLASTAHLVCVGAL
eukprot:GHVU01137731.1.p1 GENE.GHVU01137731.1~~GHVU01137731.1.p1  ORF type:complete len:115 (+),score=8.93 GHVU01137731.1:225-569(+)